MPRLHVPCLLALILVAGCDGPPAAGPRFVADDKVSGDYHIVLTSDWNTMVGFYYAPSMSSAMSPYCAGMTVLAPSADGTMEACVEDAYVSAVTDGRWEELALWYIPSFGYPVDPFDADFTELGCRTAPDGLLARYNFDAFEDDPYYDGAAWYTGETDVLSQSVMLLRGATQVDDGMVMRGLALAGSTSSYAETMVNDDEMNVGTGDFSLALWVRLDPTDATSSVRTLVDKRDATTGVGYSLYLYNRRPGLQMADGAGYTNYTTSSAIVVPNDGNWHQLLVAVSRATSTRSVKFYLDRQPKQYFTTNVRTGDLDNWSPVRIGLGWLSGSSPFQGEVDEVQIYTSALSYADDVHYLYWADVYGVCR